MQIILCIGVSIYTRFHSMFLSGSRHSFTVYSALVGEQQSDPPPFNKRKAKLKISMPNHPDLFFVYVHVHVYVFGGVCVCVLSVCACVSLCNLAGNWLALVLHVVDLYMYQKWRADAQKNGVSPKKD
jgi:hypothetical protein